MYQYINIKQIISINEYQERYKYSIRKIASKIDCSKSTVSKQLSIGLSPIDIFLATRNKSIQSGTKTHWIKW